MKKLSKESYWTHYDCSADGTWIKFFIEDQKEKNRKHPTAAQFVIVQCFGDIEAFSFTIPV